MTRRSLRLLVVDDDPVARLVLSRMLTRLGHQTDTPRPTSPPVWTSAVTAPPDLVFSDFSCPTAPADDLLAAIRRPA